MGADGVSDGESGEDGDLAAVEHVLSDSVVCTDVGECFGPATGSGQGARSVSE
ncbi:hypothetical protein [Streptomyces sviceus]|uniref:hypothetical protein n=1 Tax=Streptomyces sviceus TaxID=285530 RepID=UPI00367B1DE0